MDCCVVSVTDSYDDKPQALTNKLLSVIEAIASWREKHSNCAQFVQ